MHFRILAVTPDDDFSHALTAAGPQGTRPSMAVASTLRLMHATAKRLCHLEPWPSATMLQASTGQLVPLMAAPTAPPGPMAARFKVNLVSDQASEVELEVLPDAEVTAPYSNYAVVAGGLPPADEDPSVYQLSVVADHIKNLRVPYVDFSIFVPHANRHMKRLKMNGSMMGADGRLVPVELYMPPTYDQWEKCYNILATILRMTKVVSLVAVDRYRAHIRKFATRYGPKVWHLVYQADVRMRSEHMERMRISAMHDRAVAMTSGSMGHPFDPSSPYQYLWDEACKEKTWWSDELTENAMLVLTHTASLSTLVSDDAAIVATGSGYNPARQAPPTAPPPAFVPQGAKKTAKPPRVSHQVANGVYVANRRSVPLCEGFQTGACTELDARTLRCSRDSNRVHQCNKCLGPSHGANVGTGCPATSPPEQHSAPRFNKGGKGKGKGKGGKGKGYTAYRY